MQDNNRQRRWVYLAVGSVAAGIIAVGVTLLQRFLVKGDWRSAKTLADMGYKFNEEEQLIEIATGKRFEFRGQEHYEKLGDLVTEYVQQQLKSRFNLQEIMIPEVTSSDQSAQCNIFVSPDYKTNPKMLVLIQGSGQVRPGIWGRALCINDSLRTGTMFSFIERGIKDGYSIVIANPNQNSVTVGGVKKAIPCNESPEAHVIYLYKHFIEPSAAKEVFVVSHSYGGITTVNLIKELPEAAERITAVAFTDSVHSRVQTSKSDTVTEFLKSKTRNWITSQKPLDTPLKSAEESAYGCECVSAGTTDHASTNAHSMESIFKFFESRSSK